jgi:hypothetical protein
MGDQPLLPLMKIHWDDVATPLMVCLTMMLAGLTKIGFLKVHQYAKKEEIKHYEALFSKIRKF